MMTSESVLAWLQTLPIRADNYYCGICEYVIEFVIYYEEETAWEQ